MDATKLLHSFSVANEYHLSLLLEGGAETPEAFTAFQVQHSSEIYSLYRHPQLAEARNYGPWLLDVKHKADLGGYIAETPGVVGAIVSTRSPGALAMQLATACTIIDPQGNTALVRFYARHVVSVLAQQNQQQWHALLFKGITQWWTPSEDSWQPVAIASSMAKNPRDHAVRLDDKAWKRIADNPEISALLAQWREMPASQHFPPCTQREMAIKALDKAKAAGITSPRDQKLYALCYLDGGKKVLESEAMQALLPEVIQGNTPLSQLLNKLYALS